MNRWGLKLAVTVGRRWVDRQQAGILAHGMALTAAQAHDAALAGVKLPERVRLSCVDVIPAGLPLVLRWASPVVRRLLRDTLGITFGHGICVRRDCQEARALLVHELVHVGQYERYGSTAAFLQAYLGQCLDFGYPDAPLEREAERRTFEICGRPGALILPVTDRRTAR